MSTIPIRSRIIRFIDFLEIGQVLAAVSGWLLGFPLSLLIRRDPRLTAVIGRPGSTFSDNSKYFFLYAAESAGKDEKVVFLTTDPAIRDMINAAGGESAVYPSLKAFYLLLRCRVLAMDWLMIPYIYPLTHGAKLVQIWHGAPLKYIELDLYKKGLERMRACLRLFLKLKIRLIGRYPVYDVVVATSQEFIKRAFHSCFAAKKFIAAGYPRNDVLLGCPAIESVASRLALINVDQGVLNAVDSAKSNGNKICLYVPTFREEMDNPFTTQIDLLRLSKFALRNNLLFVLKLHPVMHGLYCIRNYPGLIEYAPLRDVYPLMPLCDLLITDYSSIYFDFLLLDRPILFFAYDLDDYLTKDRPMYFDYNAITPGAKCRNHDELESKMEAIIASGWDDGYAAMRKQVRSFTHDYMDNQSHRRLLAGI